MVGPAAPWCVCPCRPRVSPRLGPPGGAVPAAPGRLSHFLGTAAALACLAGDRNHLGLMLAPRSDAAAVVDRPVSGPRVLVVDRQTLFGAALRSLLIAPPLAAAVTTGTRTDVALAMAANQAVDLVVCDVLAGPVDAHSLAHGLAAAHPPVPLLLLGELDELAPALPLLLEGACGELTKRVPPADLVAAAGAVLDGHLVVSSDLVTAMLSGAKGSVGTVATAPLQLSRVEREVFAMIGQAQTVAAIALARGISRKTVRNHMASIYRKLELRNRTEAMLLAARMGLASP